MEAAVDEGMEQVAAKPFQQLIELGLPLLIKVTEENFKTCATRRVLLTSMHLIEVFFVNSPSYLYSFILSINNNYLNETSLDLN